MIIRVLLVEDDRDLSESLARYLGRMGIEVRTAESIEALNLQEPQNVDIILLDINLPGENGMIAATRFRQQSNVGIIMLTARSAVEDRIMGLSIGADSYLIKPVDPRELEAAIRSLHRRLVSTPPALSTPPLNQDTTRWVFDNSKWSLCPPNGQPLVLSAMEYHFVSLLVQNAGEAVSRERILSGLGKYSGDAEARSLDTLLSRLRRKVEIVSPETPLPIRSVRGIGYVFAESVEVIGR